MSFGINGPDNIPAIQKSHHTNDGGAGNLGYFQQGKKKKDEEEKQQESDTVEFSTKKNMEDFDNDPIMIDLTYLGKKIKSFWTNMQPKEKPEGT